MSNTAEHGELGEIAQRKSITHPRKEMSQAIMASSDPFWNARAATRKGQGANTVRSEDDIWVGF